MLFLNGCVCFQKSLRRFSLQASQRDVDDPDTPPKTKKSGIMLIGGGKSGASSGFSRMSFNTKLNPPTSKKTESNTIVGIPEEG